ncbi:MAG: hypothetical protein ACE5GF_00645 [Thermodesulfobacteriota bacterium]
MSIFRLIIAAILALSLSAPPAMAGMQRGEAANPCVANPCAMQNPCAVNPCAMKNPCMMKHHKWGKKMAKHHRMMTELMEMIRETMVILKNLDHRPTPAEKRRLGKMADRLDTMIKKHEKMREKHGKM